MTNLKMFCFFQQTAIEKFDYLRNVTIVFIIAMWCMIVSGCEAKASRKSRSNELESKF